MIDYNLNRIKVTYLGTIYFVWILFIHIIGSQYFSQSNLEFYLKLSNLAILFALIPFVLFFHKIDKNSLVDVVLIVLFAIVYFYSRKGILIFLFILLARHIDFSLFIKIFLTATFVGILFSVGTYVLGLTPEVTINLYRDDGTFRNLLGYRFPTFLPNYYFHMILCWIFVRREKIRFLELAIMVSINYCLYILTDTKAVFYLINLSALSILLINYFNISYKTFFLGWLFRFFTKYSFILFGLLAIYLQVSYDQAIEWMANLNTMLSGRLALGHWGYELYGLKPFGSLVEFVTMLNADENNKFFYIDSAYMQLVLIYGFVLYILISLRYYFIAKDIISKQEHYFGFVLILLFAHSLTDPQLLSPEFNPFMLCLGYYGLEKYKLKLFS